MYFANHDIDRSFLKRTGNLLRSLDGLAKELQEATAEKLRSSVQLELTAVRRITLTYHEVRVRLI